MHSIYYCALIEDTWMHSIYYNEKSSCAYGIQCFIPWFPVHFLQIYDNDSILIIKF